MRELKGFSDDVEEGSGRSLDYYRTLVKGCSEQSIEESRLATELLRKMLDSGRENHVLGRRLLYKLMVSNNANYQAAKQQNALLLQAEGVIRNRMQRAHAEHLVELNRRHEEEKRESGRLWEQVFTSFDKLSTERTDPISKVFEDAVQQRGILMGMLRELRQDAILSNIGVNMWTGSIMQQVIPGTFVLTEKQVDYILGEIFPLVQEAAKKNPKGIQNQLGEKDKIAQRWLEQHDGRETIRQLNVYQLNHLLDRYKIPKPAQYVKDIGWLGDGEANFHEYFVRERARMQHEMQAQAQQLSAEAQARLSIQPPAPNPNPTAADGSTSSAAASSSSSPSSASAPESVSAEA